MAKKKSLALSGHWSEPYHGLTHLGRLGAQLYRVSVADWGRFAELTLWFPGCAFSPQERTFRGRHCLGRAKAAGERYLRSHRHQVEL